MVGSTNSLIPLLFHAPNFPNTVSLCGNAMMSFCAVENKPTYTSNVYFSYIHLFWVDVFSKSLSDLKKAYIF